MVFSFNDSFNFEFELDGFNFELGAQFLSVQSWSGLSCNKNGPNLEMVQNKPNECPLEKTDVKLC